MTVGSFSFLTYRSCSAGPCSFPRLSSFRVHQDLVVSCLCATHSLLWMTTTLQSLVVSWCQAWSRSCWIFPWTWHFSVEICGLMIVLSLLKISKEARLTHLMKEGIKTDDLTRPKVDKLGLFVKLNCACYEWKKAMMSQVSQYDSRLLNMRCKFQ